MSWLGYAILALLSFAGYDLLSRKLAVQSKNPRAFAAVFYFIVALTVPVLLFIEPVKVPQVSFPVIVLTFFGLLSWILFGRFEYDAHKHVEASTLTIVERLAPVINLILSVLFLYESLTFLKIIGLFLTIIASIMVIGFDWKKSKGMGYALLTTLFLGIGWTFDKVLTPIYGVILFSFLSFFSPSIANAAIPPIRFSVLQKELRIGVWKLVILALLNIIGYGAMIKAFTLGEVSRVVPVATSTPPLVVLGAALLLKERKDLAKKIFAAFLVSVAIFLMR